MDRAIVRAFVDDLALHAPAVPHVAANLFVAIARHVEFDDPVSIQIRQDRGVLESR